MKGHNQINDEIINIIYLAVTKVCKMQVAIFKTFKLDYIKEMRKWIYYCGEVFLDYFDCLSVAIRLLIDQTKVVRLATLDLIDKLTRSEGINVFIKEASVNELAKHVFCRFTDVDSSVALRAMEVYASLLERYIEEIEILPEDFHTLTETLYHIDYKFGSGCGKCLIEIMKLEDSDETHMLLNICKIAKRIRPRLKPLLVESLSDHTPVLENWDLYLTVFQDKCDIEVDISLIRVLSELLFESVCQVVTGKSSMERKNSKTRSVDKDDHRKVADKICPNLKSFLIIYRDEPVIAKNILKVVSKLEVDAIGGENLSYIESFLMISMKPFKYWEDTDVLEAHLDFLNHVKTVSKNGENAFEELNKYCCEELLGSLKQEEYYLEKIKKLALVCKHVDLTEVLDINSIFSYDFRVESAEYNDEVLKLQSSIFVWRIKNLTTVSKEKQNENIEHFKYESDRFFLKCIDLMGNEDISTKIKAFERYLDTSINVCDVLEHAGKQIQGLDELKPSLNEDLIAQQQLIDVLELVLISSDIPVQTRQKYIANFVKIAGFGVLPMKIVSNIFKYYQKYDNDYGQLIEQILTRIWESEKNWVPVLVINSIVLLYEAYIRRHDAIDIRSEDAKDILKLCRKFADFKMVSNPDCVVKIMYFAINYAIGKKSYDILLFVKVFTACLSTEKRNVLLDHLRRFVPAEEAKNDALLYFSNSLKASSAANRTMVTPAKTPQKTPTKRGRPPKLGKTEKKQQKRQSSTQKKKNNSIVKNIVDLTGEETRKRQSNTQNNENNSTVENDVDLTSEEST
ncbi:cohesin subunit SA-1-like isoform X2 [Sitophilus oryzae]|nr:cohesin subunit SA-1-like isoform X2 [Sitophilus oryzae]